MLEAAARFCSLCISYYFPFSFYYLLFFEGGALGPGPTHHLPLSAAPEAYATFQKKQDGMIKTLIQPKSG